MPTWRLVFTCHTKYNVVKRPRARSVGWRPCNLRFDLMYIVLHIYRHIWFTIYCIAYGRATSVFSYTNIKLKRLWVHGMIWTLENTEGAIKTRQSREAGNIGYTRRRKTKQKHNTICIGHHYANTNNVNKTWTLLQTPGGKDEPNIVVMRKS